MIPEGHTIEDIKKREQIIRDFYREWKKKSISRQCEMLNFYPLYVVEVYALRCDAMRAGTSRYPLHRPTTTYYYLCCKDMQFFSICKTCTYQLQKGVSKWVFNL